MFGPKLLVSEKTHANKYRGHGESFREAMSRIAYILSDENEHYFRFRDALLNMRFLPAGRIQAAIGTSKVVTAINCFISGTIADTYTESGGIMDRASEAARTMRMGGGIGYDFSPIRPRGELVKTLQTQASGPVSFMPIYNSVCMCTSSAGHRRGAQMASLRVDHPDIEEFIRSKQNDNALTGFNISVGITNDFMIAVKHNRPFNLVWGGRVYKTIEANVLWEAIMRSTWDWAEPGVLFLDTINKMNNLHYCETISTTNPCGEQPMPPYSACLLGSFNLTKYMHGDKTFAFDWEQFRQDIPVVVRAMDNVIENTNYPLERQEWEHRRKRRMGLGITGLANAGEALGYVYGSDAFITFEEEVLSNLAQFAYEASVGLAEEKGKFPALDIDAYMESEFIKTLPRATKELIGKHGIRNSHLLSIAPTGTISLCADNISSGIEPVIEYEISRYIEEFDGPKLHEVTDYAYSHFGVRGKLARHCTINDHMKVLETAYRYVDSAVSKTCNVDPDTPWDEFKNIYFRAWENGCKGCTTFNPKGQRAGIFQLAVPQACVVDPESGRKDCDV